MGTSSARQNSHKIPTQGCRIIQILNPELEQRLQPFTDYIVQPSPQQLKTAIGSVTATIFSTLDYSLRQQVLPISHNHIGAKIKVSSINDCCLKVTKVFPNSPSERLGIASQQYIVGLLEAQFTSLSTFAQALRTIIDTGGQIFTLAVCNQLGITKLVQVPVSIIKEWRSFNQGILGCELAQGWMHRFKGKPRRLAPSPSIPSEVLQQQAPRDTMKEGLVKIGELQMEEGNEQWQQIERKVGGQLVGETVEVTFKGLLKSEYLDDASKICRCKIYDKSCERCWAQREGKYYFFNKKTNRIISIQRDMLLRTTQQ